MTSDATSYLLRGGRIIDGTGRPARVADVLVQGNRITRVAPGLQVGEDVVQIDAGGRIVCPGFIDMHSHSDAAFSAQMNVDAKSYQGITHEVVGQDGMGYVPRDVDGLSIVSGLLRNWNGPPPEFLTEVTSVSEYLAAIKGRSGTNVSVLVPHGALRIMALKEPSSRVPDTAETARMREILTEALDQGAVGMSAGLVYYPGQFAKTEELIALCEVVADADGFFSPHHRNYGPDAFVAYEEMLEIARRTGVRLHLTHANLSFPMNAGRAEELVALIDRYEADGCEVTFDSYPYDSGATSLAELLPSSLKSSGGAEFWRLLEDSDLVELVRESMEVRGSDSFHGVPVDWTRIRLSDLPHPSMRHYLGLTVAQAATIAGLSAADFVVRVLAMCELDVGVITHYGNIENTERLLTDRRHCVGTDGLLAGESPHPRAYGAFSRYLSQYVRDTKAIGLEEGIRKITGLPAGILGLDDSGKVAENYRADLVVIDLDEVRDSASFDNPRERALGTEYVFVNGVPVIWNGKDTGSRPGKGVRRHGPFKFEKMEIEE